MNVLRPLQGTHCLKVAEMADDMMICQNSPCTQDISCHPCDLHGLPHVIQFGQGDLGRLRPVLIQQPSQMIGQQLRLGDLNHHLAPNAPEQSDRTRWLIKDLPFHRKGFCCLIAGNGRPQSPTRDPVTGMVKALENRFKPLRFREEVLFRYRAILEYQKRGRRSPIRKLSLDQGGLKSLAFLIQQGTPGSPRQALPRSRPPGQSIHW